jgi:hypothetical protein
MVSDVMPVALNIFCTLVRSSGYARSLIRRRWLKYTGGSKYSGDLARGDWSRLAALTSVGSLPGTPAPNCGESDENGVFGTQLVDIEVYLSRNRLREVACGTEN